MWLPVLALGLLGIGAVCAAHIPGVATVIDGNPDGPPPYTDRTENADEWLRELPAIDTNYRTAQAARRTYDDQLANYYQQGGNP